jgi:hypothetical protein
LFILAWRSLRIFWPVAWLGFYLGAPARYGRVACTATLFHES